ncbi:MAG TPA: DegT/DnrJ/EryC1/StrS family aminotransferase [Candidatus Paceibacterota bacterium]|nr:DegT/DnrJ/EryC1/StrS family aminotransferase [Candidatus Paceibacterota bacterium]
MAQKPKQTIPLTRPTIEPYAAYAPAFKNILKSGRLTMGPYGAALEARAAAYLGVKHAIAVSSCTSGMMLVMKALDLKGEIIMPSFTFSASALPAIWNNLSIVYADCKDDTYEIDPVSVEKCITKKTSVILGTHVFGVVCDVAPLEKIAKKHGLKLIFDAAHAFGAKHAGVKAGGFGDAEIFSMTPTKVMTAAEGGIIATNDDSLAALCRIGRNYGDDGSGTLQLPGLSARLSEFHAVVALESLRSLDKNIARRERIVAQYTNALSNMPGISFQHIPVGNKSTYKDFSIRIDPARAGFTRDDLRAYLLERGIASKPYFFPPLHRIASLAATRSSQVPMSETVAREALSLPLFSHMTRVQAKRVTDAITKFYDSNQDR